MIRKINKLCFGIFLCVGWCFSAYAIVNGGNIFEGMQQKKSDDGPVTICSNQITYNGEDHQLIYSGNVIVIQIKGVAIQCQKNGGDFSGLNAKDKPNYTFWVSPKITSSYQKLSEMELQRAKDICKQYKGCRYLSGQKLIVNVNPETNKVDQVQMTVNDKKHHAKFYSWPFAEKQSVESSTKKDAIKNDSDASSKQSETYAEGQVIQFLPNKNLLEIVGQAKVDRGGAVFSGNKVTYNTKTQLVQVPNTGEGRSTMIIDNGLLKE